MIFWMTVKKNLTKEGYKMLNEILEHHMVGVHALSLLYLYLYYYLRGSSYLDSSILISKIPLNLSICKGKIVGLNM